MRASRCYAAVGTACASHHARWRRVTTVQKVKRASDNLRGSLARYRGRRTRLRNIYMASTARSGARKRNEVFAAAAPRARVVPVAFRYGRQCVRGYAMPRVMLATARQSAALAYATLYAAGMPSR